MTCSGDPDAEEAASRGEGWSFSFLVEECPGVLALYDDDAIELLAFGLVQGHQHNPTRLGLGRQQLSHIEGALDDDSGTLVGSRFGPLCCQSSADLIGCSEEPYEPRGGEQFREFVAGFPGSRAQ